MSQSRQPEAGRLSFQVLGSFQALRNHERIELGPLRQQAVLLPLVLRPGQAVTAREILNDVWANAVPASGIALVRTYISRLRLILGPDMIVRCPAGYYLQLDPDRVDLTVFDEHAIEARELRRHGQLESSATAWRKALGLWRGPPLPEIPGLFAENNRHRLIDLHLSALEECWDTEILLGRHTELLVELSAAVRDKPLRESLTRLFMLASYRSGRRVDAIVAFEQIQHRLANELAVPPAPVLQQLYDRIRSGDPELMYPT
ncbi:MAG: AfsR/SARP family transcriptional regulator [Pseudonocardiaceae bacterium]